MSSDFVIKANLQVTGTVTATTFSGSGASLTSIPQSAVTSLTSDLALKAPLASPTFTGTVALSATTSLASVADTATAATHYFVETATDGYIRPKTLANVKSEIVTTAAVNSAAATTVGTITSGTWTGSVIGAAYIDSAIARLAGPTFTGTLTLSATTSLASVADTATAATHYFVETATDGYIRPKTLANVKSEIVTTAAVNAAAATTVGTITTGVWNAGAITTSGDVTISKAQPILSLSSSSGNTFVYVSGPAASTRNLIFRTGTSKRWVILADATAESYGTDAGSNFAIRSYDDDDVQIGTPIQITRAGGNVTLGSNLYVNGGVLDSTSATFSLLPDPTSITFGAAANVIAVKPTGDSTSSTTGGVTFEGGVGIAKALYVGTNVVSGTSVISPILWATTEVSVTGNEEATSTSTGAITTSGGIGVTKSIWVGQEINHKSFGFAGVLTTDQALTSGTTFETLLYDTEVDPQAALNTGTGEFTIPVTGIWMFSGYCEFTSNATGVRSLRILSSASAVPVAFVTLPAANGYTTKLSLSGFIGGTAGDVVVMAAWQTSGGDLNALNARFGGTYLGRAS